jgi:hypothetical protein
MENNLTPPASQKQTQSSFVDELIWLGKSFVFPCGSKKFYKQAPKRGIWMALIFTLIFVFIQSSIGAIRVANSLNGVGGEITSAYERGEIATIRIENGIATSEGKQQYIFTDQRTIVGIDTSGYTTGIDTGAYSEGILITQNELHFLSEDGYEVIPLNDLHEYFGNPIILDKANVLEMWNKFASIINLVVFVGGFFVNIIGRFSALALLGLVIWGVISSRYKNVGYMIVFIVGMYAYVPVSYLGYIFQGIGFEFCGYRLLLLIIAWTVGMIFVLEDYKDQPVEIEPDPFQA